MKLLKICRICPESIDLCPKSLSLITKYGPLFKEDEAYSFCNDCLLLEIKKRCQNHHPKTQTENLALLCEGEALEGIDYYIENQFYIFTAWSHLKRGYCCGNNCRHCPY